MCCQSTSSAPVSGTNEATGEVNSIIRAAAAGQDHVLEELRADLGISHDHIIYMGDGSSDLP